MLTTPRGLLPHIGLFGCRNAGKSSWFNALTGQERAIVSAWPGSTTDPVEKAYELLPFGPVLFVDTAGLDDEGELGMLRVQKTRAVLARVDLVVLLVSPGGVRDEDRVVLREARERGVPHLVLVNHCDVERPAHDVLAALQQEAGRCLTVSSRSDDDVAEVRRALLALLQQPAGEPAPVLVGDLLAPQDLVLLVVPIDISAPKGRLILPQVMTLREVLDRDACALVVKEQDYAARLARLDAPPALVVCDSQVVQPVVQQTPDTVPLTTFSILMSRFKGDMVQLAQGAGSIRRLLPGDRVLIAEACSHHAQDDDIGRVKIPRLLARAANGPLEVDVVAGRDFPDDLSGYQLVVQCGGCMVTRQDMLARQRQAARQGVPVTNYGMAISVAQGVIERTLACFPAALAAYRQAGQQR